ncbi:(2Fe-2S)-binding protein [Ensifer sp. Root31]|uniref:(2Fe-2S)-binding protein n=1 Tax=Ensifer sp. Root31 TaxID=1736512 RepID=UPI0009E9C23E|nr:(2Fe-2S)-binding protein [Ensifer sp. Root31]
MPFKRLYTLCKPDNENFLFEDRWVPFHPGETLAGALLAAGVSDFRQTPDSGSQRGPWCLMGICFECLLRVDGQDNQRACMTTAQSGMIVERQIGPRRDAAGAK